MSVRHGYMVRQIAPVTTQKKTASKCAPWSAFHTEHVCSLREAVKPHEAKRSHQAIDRQLQTEMPRTTLPEITKCNLARNHRVRRVSVPLVTLVGSIFADNGNLGETSAGGLIKEVDSLLVGSTLSMD